MDTNSHLLFQKWSKLMQDEWPKGRIALETLGRTPEVIFPNFSCNCIPWCLTYIPSFLQIHSGLGEL